MGSVYWKRDVLYIAWRDVAGKKVARPTTAKTKTEGKRLLLEVERKVERQRLGLEAVGSDAALTLGQLCEWWLEKKCPKDQRYDQRVRLTKHVTAKRVGSTLLHILSVNDFESLFDEMETDGYAPGSIVKVRGTLRTVYNKARKASLWTGANLPAETEPRDGPKPNYKLLLEHEIDRLLAAVPAAWRGEFATAVYMALRKGEVLGLLKTDVDLFNRILSVNRSYDKDTTKAGSGAQLPIPDVLVPHLKRALESPGRHLFPGRKGQMRTKEADPQKVLRSALTRAGLVEGYRHTCRRCKHRGSPYEEVHGIKIERKCPQCGMRLWVSPMPRHMRFHDLRHSTATILLASGTPMQVVSKILRHARIQTTLDIYGHLATEDLRYAINTIGTKTRSAATPQLPEAATQNQKAPSHRLKTK